MPITERIRRSVFLCSLPAIILSTACLIPYLNKAFTIDDPFFLLQAQQIRKSPSRPMAMEICWVADRVCGPVANTMPPNVLMSYCLVPVGASGNPERFAHWMQIVALWFGIAATVSLAFRLGFGDFAALAAGLILAATPPVLAMASTAMPDILAMSLGVIGIERLLAWKQEGKIIQGLMAAAALGLAPFARVHLLMVWPIAALLLRDDARIFDLRSWLALPKRLWWPLIGAAFVLGACLVLVHEPGSGVKTPYIIPAQIFNNVRSYFIYWVLAMPLGLAWIVVRNRRLKLWPVWLAAIVAIALWKILVHPTSVPLATLSAPVGVMVLFDVFFSTFESRDYRRVALALWLLLPLVAVHYIHLPVKYLVACAPAAALLVAGELQLFRWRIAALSGSVAAGVLFASLILNADAKFAEMGREATVRLIAPRVAAGQRVWFASQWGFYWYALKAGALVLKTDDVPASGDYFAKGEMEGWPTTLKRLPPAVLVDTFIVSGSGGRTMSPKDHAGLYSNSYGDYMWAWGTGEWNRYELWRIQ